MGMAKAIPVRRYSLGAEELIEMGRTNGPSRPDRRPFLSGRSRKNSLGAEELIEMGGSRRSALGDLVDLTGASAPFLAQVLSTALDTLSDVSGKSLDELSQAADVAHAVFSGLLQRLPGLATLYAEVLLAGGALARFGLSVQEISIRGLGTILAGIAGALRDTRTEEENQVTVNEAFNRLVSLAPEEMKAEVKTVLESSGVSAADLAPRIDLSTGVVTPDVTPAPIEEP